MSKRKPLYTTSQLFSSVLMLAMLTWLTVCLPFVNQSQKVSKAQTEQTDGSETESDGTNPLSNTNEEKSESGTSLLAEYLHEVSQLEHNFITLTTFYKCHPSDLYIAFHPELVIPPPEA